VTFETLDIRATAELMLTEMGHPFSRGEKVYDVTFENVQAGLRTDYLFRLAISVRHRAWHRRFVELALGWSHTVWATRCRTTTSTVACPKR